MNALPGGKESIETRLTNKAAELWKKMENSKSSINKKIVHLVNALLSKIPWFETSLRSIPSRTMINRFTKEGNEPINAHEIQRAQLTSEHLKAIPLFYPLNLSSPSRIVGQIAPDLPLVYQNQRKFLLRDILLLPLTIPFILVPVIPNVPGFYLVYRAYCHWNVLKGIDHLRYLMIEGDHLDSIPIFSVDKLYLDSKDAICAQNVELYLESGEEGPETLLISEDIVPKVCEAFGVPELSENLLVAIEQERNRLEGQSEGKAEEKE
ncbi:DEKNAAC105035 [Brettanomyces naardenensis]|uniref:DEKNAAC105035 n=1 Tax=Brettanomyces naardenensis TaxID=13370 RepID=A0A448YSG2_BRENA|nr:DEKNAAC105035 [Brettanomyces naardenensis]